MIIKKFNNFLFAFLLGLSSTLYSQDLFDRFVESLAHGFGRKVGTESASYLWHNYRTQLIIGTAAVVAIVLIRKEMKRREKAVRKVHQQNSFFA